MELIARVVDYGGLFWDDVLPGHELRKGDHRLFRPEGWVEAGREKLERMRPLAERHGLTMIQLAAQWELAQDAGEVATAPTLIQEAGAGARPVEDKRAELAATPAEIVLQRRGADEIRAIGDNTGCMALKGASPDHEGEARADRWGLTPSWRGGGALGDRARRAACARSPRRPTR